MVVSKPFLEPSSCYIIKALVKPYQDSCQDKPTSQDTCSFHDSLLDSMPFHWQVSVDQDTEDTVHCKQAADYNSQDCMPYYKINNIVISYNCLVIMKLFNDIQKKVTE